MNFTQLIGAHARRSPHRDAAVTDERTVSFAEFWHGIASVGQFYLDSGICAGDRVLLILPNGHDFLHFHFGALKIEAISVPVRYDYTGWEVRRMALNCEPRLLISTPEWLEKNLAQLELPASTKVLSVEEARAQLRPGSLEVGPTNSRTIASINYSYFGGGYPKGAMLTHANHIYAATGYARHQGFRSSDRLLIMLPMCHVYALSGCVNAGLVRGATLVLTNHHMPGSILRDIDRHRITVFSSVPSMFEYLAAYKRRERYDLSSLRRLVTGGAYMSAAEQHEYEKALGAEMVQGYGLTECLPVICNPPGAGNRRGTLGIPGRRDIHIRIIGEEGRPLPPRAVGEIQIRSTTSMVGYYRLPEDTRKIFDGEWLRTGDLGALDEEGYLHFQGMTKPILNLHGNKVDPVEVREVLMQHPRIASAEVLTQLDARGNGFGGEIRMCARVTPKQNEAIAESEIRAFCLGRLAAYKIPQAIVLQDAAHIATDS